MPCGRPASRASRCLPARPGSGRLSKRKHRQASCSTRGMSPREGWSIARQAAKAWNDDYAPSMGAALSYYTLFSIAPLILIVIALAGLVFGADAARGAIFEQLEGLIGAEGAKGVEGLLQAANQPREGMIASIVGVVVLI